MTRIGFLALPPRITILVLASIMMVTTTAGCQFLGNASAATSPGLKHIFIIVMENKSYDQVIGASDAPYINQLAGTYALATQYYGVAHPSLPNYLALVSGSTQGMTTDCPDCSFDARNLADQLDKAKVAWRVYQEDMPAPCFNDPSGTGKTSKGSPLYARKHNPLMYFKSVSGNPQLCNQIVPLSQFDSDLQQNKISNFTWVSPNQMHDMHDGTVRDGDNWLASFVPKILGSQQWKDGGALFIVWDEAEGDNRNGGGHVPALIISPKAKQGYRSDTQFNHYSWLRTVEDAWGLGALGGATDARPMLDFFQK